MVKIPPLAHRPARFFFYHVTPRQRVASLVTLAARHSRPVIEIMLLLTPYTTFLDLRMNVLTVGQPKRG
jgi:hypothetical protein